MHILDTLLRCQCGKLKKHTKSWHFVELRSSSATLCSVTCFTHVANKKQLSLIAYLLRLCCCSCDLRVSTVIVLRDNSRSCVRIRVQLQPHWQKQDEPDFVKFGDAWNCVGFTTPGILTGLFLVFIFIFIGAYGITWMMDIRTMDRFDDPKGKTITVNTAGD
ncbi:vacuolar ATP synthase subunit S1 [Culex quinquefasciatus]|uniref:Vacuolar ATP synthase subunit S1 n=1 Tax=Culex quinquefasciatus TaxID=7176 RepID=B0X811_CULQU|nr:vacuolar ATP synthase subunit S1 [Culex quinquefasciatus]|eukprot:XP_001865783.1 vacuolar ATP synthase subunit S1 [Culex quinquefasciatus]